VRSRSTAATATAATPATRAASPAANRSSTDAATLLRLAKPRFRPLYRALRLLYGSRR